MQRGTCEARLELGTGILDLGTRRPFGGMVIALAPSKKDAGIAWVRSAAQLSGSVNGHLSRTNASFMSVSSPWSIYHINSADRLSSCTGKNKCSVWSEMVHIPLIRFCTRIFYCLKLILSQCNASVTARIWLHTTAILTNSWTSGGGYVGGPSEAKLNERKVVWPLSINAYLWPRVNWTWS